MELREPKVEVGIQIFEEDYGSMPVRLEEFIWIIAAKEPSPEMIAACEERYKEIYRQHDSSIVVEFPKHYPTSALIGCVDVVDVISSDTARSIPLPDTV